MRIAVVGGTGRTGRQVVAGALARGLQVSVLARSADRAAVLPATVDIVLGDVLDVAAVRQCLRGCTVAVSALGIGTARTPTTVYSAGVTNQLSAMAELGVRRLAVISAAPLGPRDGQPLLTRRIVMPVLDRVFAASYADMRRMEAVLTHSTTDWTCLRPPRLLDRTRRGAYRIGLGAPPPGGSAITLADLADALLDSLDDPGLRRRPVFVAN